MAKIAGRCPWEKWCEISCQNLPSRSLLHSEVTPLLFILFLRIFMEGYLHFAHPPFFPPWVPLCTFPIQPQLSTPVPLESLLFTVFGFRGPFLKSGQFPCGRCWVTAAAPAAASAVRNSNPLWVFRAADGLVNDACSSTSICSILLSTQGMDADHHPEPSFLRRADEIPLP